MSQIEQRGAVTVPNLDGRSGSLRPLAEAGVLHRFAGAGPVAVLVAGIVATAFWAGFLGWCVFAAIRWAVG